MILNSSKLARRASAWMREVMVQRRWENILCMRAHRFDVRNRYYSVTLKGYPSIKSRREYIHVGS